MLKMRFITEMVMILMGIDYGLEYFPFLLFSTSMGPTIEFCHMTFWSLFVTVG